MSSSLIGQIIGHYRVLDQLGAGGMGVVYRAQDMKLGRQVAIKVLPTGNDASAEAIERFRREARTASSLNHPNICTIYGFDEHEGQCYLAMELLDGEPLDQRLGGRPLDFRTLLDIGAQIADALDAAHSEGILHRDIKPANIFITRRGQVKVLDFGLAKLTSDGRRLSQHEEVLETRAQHFSSVVGTTVGTIAYMSPEQARGEDLDPRTDLFSFGVVLYEMATGRQSFPGHTTAVVFDGILNREPVPASSINTSMPMDLDRLIAKALEKERAMRYQTAADLRADLQRLRRDSGTRVVAAASASAIGPTSAQTVMLTASGVATAPAPSAASFNQSQVEPPQPSAVGGVAAPTPHISLPSVAGAAPPASKTSWIFAGVAVAIALVAVGAGIWVTMMSPTPAVAALPERNAVEPPPPAVLPESAIPPAPAPTPSAAPITNATAAPATASPMSSTGTAKPAAASPAPPARAAAAKTLPPPPVAPAVPAVPAKDAEAIQRLDIAKAKLASNLVDQAVGDLRQIMLDYPGTAFGVDAAFLAGDALEKAGRDEDAMAAYVEFDRRFPNHARMADSQLRRAKLMQRSKVQARQTEAYTLYGAIARDYPGTPEAKQALLAKRQIEGQRRQLRATDPVLNTEVPALLVTLRALGDQFPSDPDTMLALNQLAAAYEDMDRYQAAADVLERLASQFPGNPVEVWFRLGELYDRRLKNTDKAREAYAKVPANSPRYREAQQRLNRK